MTQYVNFVEMHTSWKTVIREDRFCYSPNRRYPWLQRWCIDILRWLHCQAFDEVATITRVRPDPGRFVDTLFKQRSALLEQYHHEGEFLLVGADDYAEIMGDPVIHHTLRFDAQYMNGRELFGLRVVVLPYMKGILVLPKNFDAQR